MARKIRIGDQHGWLSVPLLTFGQNQATTVNLATYVYNPKNKVLVYAAVDALPSGVTLSGSIVTWTGTGTPSTTPVRFTITFGGVTQTSPQASVVILLADTTPPSIPTGPSAAAVSSSQINLTWGASSDPVVVGATTSGLSHYRVFRDGIFVANASTPSFSDTGLAASTLYSYRSSAVDLAGNESPQSAAFTATTEAGAGGGTDPLDAARLPFIGTWEGFVGVEGGIPSGSWTRSGSIIPSGASQATIASAITAAGANQYVELAAGTFNITSELTIAKSNFELRGAVDAQGKPASTINVAGGGDRLVHIRASTWDLSNAGQFTIVSVTSPTGASLRGATSVTLAASPAGRPAVGQWVFITSTQTFIGTNWSDLHGNEYQEGVRVTAVNGNTVSFTPAINADYLTSTVQMSWRSTGNIIRRAGIRNLRILGNGAGHVVGFSGADECWALNCYTQECFASGYHFYPYGSHRLEIRHCESAIIPNNSNSGYVLNPAATSRMLVIDNYFHTIPNVMPMFGVTNSAFVYNYCNDFPYAQAAWLSQGVFNHGSHNAFNLFEGNWYPCNHNDNFGNGSSRNTLYFRNRIRGWDATPAPNGKTDNTKPFHIGANTLNMTIAGNVLGENGYHTTYQTSSNEFANNVIYSTQGTIATLTRLGNYNTVNDAVPASEALSGGTALVTSYLFSAKPSFFGSLPWPWCDPGNYPQSNSVLNLPAGYRAANGTDPP